MNARGEKYAISAVVPTHNRSAYLRKCLRALEKQTLPPQQYEVIVVDNDSIDDTPSVVKSFCERNSIFRYVHEAKPGVAIARNTGVRVSSFDFVAQTDDDAEPDPTWLERILARFREHPNDVGIVGGEVLPIWEAERPAWLSDALLRPLSAGLMWSTEARFLRANEWLIEVNSAYRKAALLRIGGFPERIGRIGEMLLSGESCANVLMQRAGSRLFYDPAILVRHHVHASRLSKTWFRRRSFWQGVSMNLFYRYVEDKAQSLGLSQPSRYTRAWEEIPVPISPAAWADLFDDQSTQDFAEQLDRLEHLGYLLESQSVVVGR